MICDALQEDELYEAYLLYASLHGLSTEEDEVRGRIASYLNNKPDEVLDDAVLAFAEDCIVAPPDVVLAHWGKSRNYELELLPGQWRHKVCESWFENGCQWTDEAQIPPLSHFWTRFSCSLTPSETSNSLLVRGARLRFQLQDSSVAVAHRQLGALGQLPSTVAREILDNLSMGLRYLPIIDALEPLESSEAAEGYKLLVILAARDTALEDIVAYTSRAFHAVRAKC